jgi:hypothetical protein
VAWGQSVETKHAIERTVQRWRRQGQTQP